MKQIKNFLAKITLSVLALFAFAQNSNAQCPAGQVEVFIDVITDTWGYECYWELVPSGQACGGITIFTGGNTSVGCTGSGTAAPTDPGAYANNTTITEGGFCLTIGASYDIIFYDDYGDGGTTFSSLGQGFNFVGSGSGNTFTFTATSAIVDDIEALSNNGEYTAIPYQQLSGGALALEANVRNNGTAAVADAVVTSTVYAMPAMTVASGPTSSTPTAVAAGATVAIPAGSFTPTMAGTYMVEYITSMTAVTDTDNSNDTSRYTVTITDGMYARDNGTIAVQLGLNAPSYGELGNVYDITNPATQMDSVLFYFGSTTIGDTTEIKVYDVAGGVPTTQIGTSGFIIITAADTGGVVKVVPVTNMTGGVLSVGTGKVYVAATDSRTGFLGLAFASGIYTPGGSMANINGGAFSDMAALGFPNPAVVRPFLSISCAVMTNTNTLTPASCGMSNGTAMAAPAGGTGPYSFLWDPSTGNQTTATATGLAAGTYVLAFADANGCVDTDTVTIVNPNSPTATSSVTSTYNGADVTCMGAADGEATAAATGGTGAYTYMWDAAAGSQATAIATGLAAGTYNVTVTDASNCVSTSSVMITDAPAISASLDTAIHVLCNGDATGSIMLTITGGTGALTYLWDNGATTEDLMNLAAGVYQGTATDANGCTIVGGETITEPSAALMASATDNANGSATASATGGTGAYTYMWDAAAANQATATATGLANGTYNVTVTDANGCTNATSVTIVGVGVNNIAGLNDLSMFPNPTNANVFVELELTENKDVTIRVTNVTGQTVLENNVGTIQSKRVELKTADLPTGVYMVQFTIGTETISRKLVVDKQ